MSADVREKRPAREKTERAKGPVETIVDGVPITLSAYDSIALARTLQKRMAKAANPRLARMQARLDEAEAKLKAAREAEGGR